MRQVHTKKAMGSSNYASDNEDEDFELHEDNVSNDKQSRPNWQSRFNYVLSRDTQVPNPCRDFVKANGKNQCLGHLVFHFCVFSGIV